MSDLNKRDLDNYITGYYGADLVDDWEDPEQDHEPPADADILEGEFEDLPEEPDSDRTLGLEAHPGMS